MITEVRDILKESPKNAGIARPGIAACVNDDTRLEGGAPPTRFITERILLRDQ